MQSDRLVTENLNRFLDIGMVLKFIVPTPAPSEASCGFTGVFAVAVEIKNKTPTSIMWHTT